MAVLRKASCAVTVTSAEVPAVTEAGVPVRARLVAAAGSTVIVGLVPVMVAVTVSVAVIVVEPAVRRVVEKVWLPLSPARKV